MEGGREKGRREGERKGGGKERGREGVKREERKGGRWRGWREGKGGRKAKKAGGVIPLCKLHPTGRETERMGGWKEEGRTYISH